MVVGRFEWIRMLSLESQTILDVLLEPDKSKVEQSTDLVLLTHP